MRARALDEQPAEAEANDLRRLAGKEREMTEMPKRIWASVPHDEFDGDVTWFEVQQVRTVEYVRADIVAELVAALESIAATDRHMRFMRCGDTSTSNMVDGPYANAARVALAKVKDAEK